MSIIMIIMKQITCGPCKDIVHFLMNTTDIFNPFHKKASCREKNTHIDTNICKEITHVYRDNINL